MAKKSKAKEVPIPSEIRTLYFRDDDMKKCKVKVENLKMGDALTLTVEAKVVGLQENVWDKKRPRSCEVEYKVTKAVSAKSFDAGWDADGE